MNNHLLNDDSWQSTDVRTNKMGGKIGCGGVGERKNENTDGHHNDNGWPRFGDHCHRCGNKMWYPFNNDKSHVNLVIILSLHPVCMCTVVFCWTVGKCSLLLCRAIVYYFIDQRVMDSPLFVGNEKLKRKHTTCSGRWAFGRGSLFHTVKWQKKKKKTFD